jgi:hypothetical protein
VSVVVLPEAPMEVPLPVVAPMSVPVPVVEPVLPVPAVVLGIVELLLPAVLEVSAGAVVDGVVVDEEVEVEVSAAFWPQADRVRAAIRASAAALAMGLVFMEISLRDRSEVGRTTAVAAACESL